MKKMIAVLVLMASVAVAADQVITITIPDAKVQKAAQGFLKIYPNTETWDDDADPETPEVAKYTTKQWIREKIRRNLIRDIMRGRQMLAKEAAEEAQDPDLAN